MTAPLRPILPPDLRAFYAHARAATYAANSPPRRIPRCPARTS
jgi:hypothetical protein